MWGYGSPGMLDIDEDRDDMLIMSVSSMYQSSLPGVDERWMRDNIHKDLVRLCNKYKDTKWLNRSQHEYCIYYACHILGSLSGLSEEACTAILAEPNIIETLLALWKGDKTWFESRCAARAINHIFATSASCMDRFRENKHNVNVAELAMKQYTECVRFVIRNCAVVPSKMEGYVTDLVLKIKDKDMQYDDPIVRTCAIESALNWMSFNGTIVVKIAKNLNMVDLFQTVDISLWERAVAMDLCYLDVKQNDTFMDALTHLSKHEPCAKLISSSDFIIKSLILSLRSRARDTLDTRYDLIILNLLKFNLIPSKYYYDLCVSLVLLLGIDRMRKYLKLYTSYGQTFMFESVVCCLQLMFGIPLEIECIESEERVNQSKCVSCHKWLKNPHKTPCKHRYCYLCIMQTKIDKETAQCVVTECKHKKFKFTKDCEKFDLKASNEMNQLRIKVAINNGKDTFIGEWNALWSYIKDNLDRNTCINSLNLNHEFEYFCDFMIRERSVQTIQELKQLRIKARNRRIEGNQYFKTNANDEAIDAYLDCLKLCPNKYTEDRVTYFSNLAISYLKVNAYSNAYKAALSGLASNNRHIKLLNVLCKCYSKTNVSDVFTANVISDGFDVLDPNLALNKVHNLLAFKFYNHFELVYLNDVLFKDRKSEIKAMSDSEYMRMIQKTKEEDPIVRNLEAKMKEFDKSKFSFTQLHFKKYRDEYRVFKEQRALAKKEVYRYLMYMLANKQSIWSYEDVKDLEEEEFVTIEALLEAVKEHFNLEPKLKKLNTQQQVALVSGYMKQVERHLMPETITHLIKKYIFEQPKYNVYTFDAWTIREMVKKSQYLTLSESCLRERYDAKYYGVKLADTEKPVDQNWREIEFDTEYDSGIDEFRSHA
eukprot:937014_1